MSPVDKLIWQLGLRQTPISRWDKRHSNEFLLCLAEAYRLCPEVFEPYASKVIKYANFWTPEVREPITGFGTADRRASFLGHFPWTSGKHPWPTRSDGTPLAPIVQLNLSTLGIGHLETNADILFQVWAWDDRGAFFTRTISLADTREEPTWEILPWSASDMYYHFEGFQLEQGWRVPTRIDWYDGRVTGELISPGSDWQLSLGRDLDVVLGCEDDPLPENEIGQKAEAFVHRLAELSRDAPQLSLFSYSEGEVLSGFFGGQMYAQQASYDDFPQHENLYSPRESGNLDENDFGLFSWFDTGSDGKLSIMRERENPSKLIAYTD